MYICHTLYIYHPNGVDRAEKMSTTSVRSDLIRFLSVSVNYMFYTQKSSSTGCELADSHISKSPGHVGSDHCNIVYIS